MRTVSARRMDAGMGRGHDLVNIAAIGDARANDTETGFGNDFVSSPGRTRRGRRRSSGARQQSILYRHERFLQLAVRCDGSTATAVRYGSMLLGNSTFITNGGSDRMDIDYSFGRFVSFDLGRRTNAIVIAAAPGQYLCGDGRRR